MVVRIIPNTYRFIKVGEGLKEVIEVTVSLGHIAVLCHILLKELAFALRVHGLFVMHEETSCFVELYLLFMFMAPLM